MKAAGRSNQIRIRKDLWIVSSQLHMWLYQKRKMIWLCTQISWFQRWRTMRWFWIVQCWCRRKMIQRQKSLCSKREQLRDKDKWFFLASVQTKSQAKKKVTKKKKRWKEQLEDILSYEEKHNFKMMGIEMEKTSKYKEITEWIYWYESVQIYIQEYIKGFELISIYTLYIPPQDGDTLVTPILMNRSWKLWRESGFVKPSASWSCVETWETWSAPDWTLPGMKW